MQKETQIGSNRSPAIGAKGVRPLSFAEAAERRS